MFGNHKIDVYHGFAHLLGYNALLVSHLDGNFTLLLAGEDPALLIGEPNEHVVVKSKVEAAELAHFVEFASALLGDGLRQEDWDLHDQLVKVE